MSYRMRENMLAPCHLTHCTDLQVAGHFCRQLLDIFVNLWVHVDVGGVPQLSTLLFQRFHHFPIRATPHYSQ